MHTFSVIEQLYVLKHILFYLFHCNISSTIDSLFFMVAKKLSAHELLYGHLSLLILANILFSSTSDDIHKFYDFLQTPFLSFLFLVCPITFQRSSKPAFFLMNIKNPCNIAKNPAISQGLLKQKYYNYLYLFNKLLNHNHNPISIIGFRYEVCRLFYFFLGICHGYTHAGIFNHADIVISVTATNGIFTVKSNRL